MVFAAGLGTRLRPLTDTMPKALVPVCGKPLLEHVLTKLIRGGYTDIVVNVHHFPDRIIGYLKEHPHEGVRIRISDERDFLRETGGALRYAAPLLTGGGFREGSIADGRDCEATVSGDIPLPEPVLVHNVDIISNLDLCWMRSQHREGALATLLVSPRKTSRYFLFDDEGRLAGWTNLATGEVRSPYGAIDPEKYRALAFSGVHLISPEIFGLMEPWGERFSIVDFYLSVCADHPVYAAVPENLQMVDVGKMETLSEAERVAESILG